MKALTVLLLIILAYSVVTAQSSCKNPPAVIVGLSGALTGQFGFAPSIFAGVGFNLITTKKVRTERTMEGKKVRFTRIETPIVRIKNLTKMQAGISTGGLLMVSLINETPIRLFGINKGKGNASLQFVPSLQITKAVYVGTENNYATTPISILVGSGLNLETKRLNIGFNVTFNTLMVKQSSKEYRHYDVHARIENRLVSFNLSYRLSK